MALSKRLRYEILNRDDFTCRYCGGRAPGVVLTVDHVLPTALGGTDDPSNLTAACKDCNAGKSSMKPGAPTVEQVSSDALRWALAIEYVVSSRSIEIEELEADFHDFEQAWWTWHVNATGGGVVPRPDNWRNSVEVWLKRGMTGIMLKHYIPKAMMAPNVGSDSTWRYYCGIIWKQITQLDEAATALLRDDAFTEAEQLENLKVEMALDEVELDNPDLIKALVF